MLVLVRGQAVILSNIDSGGEGEVENQCFELETYILSLSQYILAMIVGRPYLSGQQGGSGTKILAHRRTKMRRDFF